MHDRRGLVQRGSFRLLHRKSGPQDAAVPRSQVRRRHGQLRHPQGSWDTGHHRVQVGTILFYVDCADRHPRGLRVEYLPAYSPDLNPIELAFSLLKSKLRRNPPPLGSDFQVQEYLYLQTFGISAQDCHAFFHQSGYF